VLSPSLDGLDVNTEPGGNGHRPARFGLFGKSSPCYVAPAKRICLGQATKVRDDMNEIREQQRQVGLDKRRMTLGQLGFD
jgi:hypothetical protein